MTTEPKPTPVSEQNARYAIETAIGFGREGSNKPPTEDHWLMPYWKIGQYLGPAADSCEVLEVPARAADVATGGAVDQQASSTYVGISSADTDSITWVAQQQAATVPDGPIVAWTEKDGDEWIVYDAESDTGKYIAEYLKKDHGISVFAIRAAATTDGAEKWLT